MTATSTKLSCKLALIAIAGVLAVMAGCNTQSDISGGGKGQITSISVKHEGCVKPCPVFDVTLSRNGSATYVGKDQARFTGTFHGRVSDDDFERLAGIAYEKNLMSAGDVFHAPGADVGETVEVIVVSAGRKKTIKRDGPPGPDDLSQLIQAVDGVADKIDWK